jgi:hypothetical protein
MRANPYFLILPVFIFAAWFAVQAIRPNVGPHGGVVKPTGKYYAEAGRDSHYLYAFLLDSTMKSLSNDAMTCKAVIDFPDKTTAHLELIPFEKDGFRAALTGRDYKKCTFIFEKSGRQLNASFDNETLLVINENQ